jgi:ribokinase
MINQKSIVVIGSSNTDMVIKTEKFPRAGETILGGEFFMFPGGKGANQAVAAARLGARVTFVAKTGKDVFGNQARAQFRKENINTDFVFEDSSLASGVALITVGQNGENTIVVAPGANSALNPAHIHSAEETLGTADIVLLQLEIPMETVEFAARHAYALGRKVILNPAPAASLPESIYRNLFLITPNITEAETLTGVRIKDKNTSRKAAIVLKERGVQNVIITLGSEGAYIFNDSTEEHIKAPVVKSVDTTAAGDIFNGALAVALAEGKPLIGAVEFANQCAAISVTRMGAQSSAPFRNEITKT